MLLWFQLKEITLCLRFESQVNQAQVVPSVMSFFNKVQGQSVYKLDKACSHRTVSRSLTVFNFQITAR